MENEFLILSRTAFRRSHGLAVDSTLPVNPTLTKEWLGLARRNRVVGLWVDGLSLDDSEWCTAAYGQALHSARLTAEAERIFSNLRNSVENLRLIKGPSLAAQAWPQPGLRSFDDLDFRCEKSSFSALMAGLQSMGYRGKAANQHHLENLWDFGWGISFVHEDGYVVEFNHRMFPPHYPWPSRLTQQTPAGWGPQLLDEATGECPLPALHLLISCVHAVWHGWERLGWLADIAGLRVRHPNCLADAERMTLENTFVRRALHCGCRVANQAFGPLSDLSNVDADDSGLARQALKSVVREGPAISPELQRNVHFQFMSPWERMGYTSRRFTTPGDLDFRALPLPVCFNALYWVSRPFRYLCEGRVRKKTGGTSALNM